MDQQSEYIQRISKALFSNDVVFISSTIDYIDAIIRLDGHTAILSIYYDKARLLYRLKRFDEALEMLRAYP